ncbi:IclR family transcriptional regulator [Brevibacterium sp. FAM 24638]|uniref:IclR family transcriptional regulator n=1 Tax=unclassified Brevibacterium TaxID=2614124 RepID=UPI003C7A351A
MNEQSNSSSTTRTGQVQSVGRALAIVDLLGDAKNTAGMSLIQIAEELGVSKSTAHALLKTLKHYGFVTRIEPGPRFLLGMSLMRLGEQVQRRMPITDAAQPILQSLSNETGCTARLVVADHGYPLYVARVEGIGSVQFTAQIGRRERPHSTGVGKIILAAMDEVDALEFASGHGLERMTPNTITDAEALSAELAWTREHGYAVDRGEDVEGLICVAVGLYDPAKRCIGAISVSDLELRMSSERIDRIANLVKDHATRLMAILT